jgi:hypothetical protein
MLSGGIISDETPRGIKRCPSPDLVVLRYLLNQCRP